MSNNTFTSSLPKLSAQGSLARSDESGITVKTGGKQEESFSSVLSRQIKGNTAAEKLPTDPKTTTDATVDGKEQNVAPAILPDQASNPLVALLFANQELKSAIAPEAGGKAAAANELSAEIAAAIDPDSRKIVGSELNGKAAAVSEPNGKTPAADSQLTAPTELNGKATAVSEPNGKIPAAADSQLTASTELNGMTTAVSEPNGKTPTVAADSQLTASTELNGMATAVSELNGNTTAAKLNNKAAVSAELNDKAILSINKSAIGTPALSANSAETPTRATNMRTGPARDKSDAPITSSVTNADIAAKPGLRSEPLKATELTNALPGAMQAPQLPAGTAPGLQPNATPGANSATLTTPLGHSAWPAEFSQKVSWISTQKNQVAELHLNPPDLGPVNIVLKISDNQATALFTSPHSAVRDAIESAIPKLRESLAENGITLGQTTVSDQTPRDNSSNFMNQRAHTRTKADDTPPAEPALASLPLMTARQHKGMVDTFA